MAKQPPDLTVFKVWKTNAKDGCYFFISTRKDGQWKDHPFRWPVSRKQIREFIEEHDGGDLYFCAAPFSKPSRKKVNVIGSRFLHADLDEVNPRTLDLRPTIAWRTSPGRYAGLWRLDEWLDDIGPHNSALTYSIGADRGCWDPGHVLRIPGTCNFKYDPPPRGRLLWFNKLTYPLSAFPKPKPQPKPKPKRRKLQIDKKLKDKAPRRIMRLINAKEAIGDRSKVLWRLIHELIEAGLTDDEIFALLHGSVWNKFSDESLMRQIAKARTCGGKALPPTKILGGRKR